MRLLGILSLLLLCLGPVAGQDDDGCGIEEGDGCDACGCGDEIITDEDGFEDEEVTLQIDPFDEVPTVEEPNRPAAVTVGTWPTPKVDDATLRRLRAMEKARNEAPADVALRYRLADAYIKHRWWPQAEAELLACAKLDPKSIRPWEGLLRVYRTKPRTREDEMEELLRQLAARGAAPGPIVINEINARRGEKDWLPSQEERIKRTTYAYVELIRRRPDDVARRRAFLAHLKDARDHERILVEARALERMLPDDPEVRYDLAEAVRKLGARKDKAKKGSGAAEFKEAVRLLDENVKRAPHHAPSALRLARILKFRDKHAADARVQELEERAYFHLFVRREIATVPFRADTHRMARELGGRDIARRLWDEAMIPSWYEQPRFNQDRIHYRRWISEIKFPNPRPRDLLAAFEKLARRGDREAAAMLVSYLWHLEPVVWYPEEQIEQRGIVEKLQEGAIAAAVKLGVACYPAAERMLLAAEDAHHRRRAVRILRGLRDRRAVRPLLDALAWDVEKDFPYGVAPALEELGDPAAVAALVQAAQDVQRPRARRVEAIEALAVFQDPRCIEALSRLRKETEYELPASYALFRLNGDKEARAVLASALEGEDPATALRLLAKCEGRAVEELLLNGLSKAVPAVRGGIVALLRERYWDTSKERVRKIMLEQSGAPDAPDYVLELLGELGGAEAAGRLLEIVRSARGVRWAKAARALAQTGDARAVKYFNRARVLERQSDRRRLAEKLHEVAAKRRAELTRAADSE